MLRYLILFAVLFYVTESNVACAATCEPGYYLDDDGICAVCKQSHEPYYCPGDDKRYTCPANDMDYTDVLPDGWILIGRQNPWNYFDSSIDVSNCWVNLHISTPTGALITECPYDGTDYFCNTEYWYSAETGYYLSNYWFTTWDVWYKNVKPCTNAPENAVYTGPGTPDSTDGTIVDANDCPWRCLDGYGRTTNNTCAPLCTAGVKKLHIGNTVWAALFDEKRTSPAIHISVNNKMCYADLVPGEISGTLNVRFNGAVYHTVVQN